MLIVKPYKTISGALRALDNGGRFYNLFTAAGDNVVTGIELRKAAGVIGDEVRAHLFLAMALKDLDAAQRHDVEASLDKRTRSVRQRMQPAEITPQELDTVRPAKTCIIEGYVQSVPDSKVAGFIMIPMMMGNIMTFMTVPTVQVYQIYKLFPTKARRGTSCKIMWAKGKWNHAEGERIRFGGSVKQESTTDKKNSPKRSFLEPHYYTPLG